MRKLQLYLVLVFALLSFVALVSIALAATGDSHYFSETRHRVSGAFWKYWQEHGGLSQQGYPISDEFTEKSPLDGKLYTVQYFERAVFEMHPENRAPYDVLLSHLGKFRYVGAYGDAGAPDQRTPANPRLFKETGFSLGGEFGVYWEKHGGMLQQGLPISNEFTETSPLDGKPYRVQYFERAVFEWHPENQPEFSVLLSQLGTFRMRALYPSGPPRATATPRSTSTPGTPVAPSSRTPAATRTPGGNCDPVEESRKSAISASGPVIIALVEPSGVEIVTLRNTGTAEANIEGWTLRDKNTVTQKFVFPPGARIEAGSEVSVYTETGHPYSMNRKTGVWNDCGDALELLDGSGTVVATYAYGTHLRN